MPESSIVLIGQVALIHLLLSHPHTARASYSFSHPAFPAGFAIIILYLDDVFLYIPHPLLTSST